MKHKVKSAALVGVVLLLTGLVCSCNRFSESKRNVSEREKKIKVAVITGGHDFEQEKFLEIFAGYEDIEYTHLPQRHHSEVFEDISEWPYDVTVLYNMTQEISPKRQANFVKLLEAGVGVVALHHSIGAFQSWPEFRKIIGAMFYLQDTVEKGVIHKAPGYKHDVNFTIAVKDKNHPITRLLNDFAVKDETYKNCAFQPDNHVLLTTDESSGDESICWVRNYARAKVCYIQPGHGVSIYSNNNYRRLVARAIRWSAGKLKLHRDFKK